MRGKAHGPQREAEPEEDESGRWIGTYADAVTLLMAFFVMLYAMSETNAEKFTAFLSGLEGPFGNTAVELLPNGGGIVGDGGSSPELLDESAIEFSPDLPVVMEEGVPVEETDPSEEQLETVGNSLQEALQQVGLAALADFRQEARGLVVSVASDDVLFELGSTDVSDLGRDIIGAIADVLADYPNLVIIEGHTDDLEIAREDYSNWNLSTDRAVAVLDVLVEEQAMDPTRLGAAGFGEFRPVVPNDSATNRAKNRRVDVLIIREEQTDG